VAVWCAACVIAPVTRLHSIQLLLLLAALLVDWCTQANKKAVKEANREKRKTKTPKHVKKAHKAGQNKKKK
jgi:hypothetical protein